MEERSGLKENAGREGNRGTMQLQRNSLWRRRSLAATRLTSIFRASQSGKDSGAAARTASLQRMSSRGRHPGGNDVNIPLLNLEVPITLPVDQQEHILRVYLACEGGVMRGNLAAVLTELQLTIPERLQERQLEDFFVGPSGRSESIMQPRALLHLVQLLLHPDVGSVEEVNDTLAALRSAGADPVLVQGAGVHDDHHADATVCALSDETVEAALSHAYPAATMERVLQELHSVASPSDLRHVLEPKASAGDTVLAAFRRLGARNTDGLGYVLDSQTLRRRCESLGLTPADAEIVVNLLDRDASGEIDLSEFQRTLAEEQKWVAALGEDAQRGSSKVHRRNSAATHVVMALALGDDGSRRVGHMMEHVSSRRHELFEALSTDAGSSRFGSVVSLAHRGKAAPVPLAPSAGTTSPTLRRGVDAACGRQRQWDFGGEAHSSGDDDDGESGAYDEQLQAEYINTERRLHEISSFLRQRQQADEGQPAGAAEGGPAAPFVDRAVPRPMLPLRRPEHDDELSARVRRRVQKRKAHAQKLRMSQQEGAGGDGASAASTLPLPIFTRRCPVAKAVVQQQRDHQQRKPEAPQDTSPRRTSSSLRENNPNLAQLCERALRHFESLTKGRDTWTPAREDHRPAFSCITPRFSLDAVPTPCTDGGGDLTRSNGSEVVAKPQPPSCAAARTGSSRRGGAVVGPAVAALHSISLSAYANGAIRTSATSGSSPRVASARSAGLVHPRQAHAPHPPGRGCQGQDERSASNSRKRSAAEQQEQQLEQQEGAQQVADLDGSRDEDGAEKNANGRPSEIPIVADPDVPMCPRPPPLTGRAARLPLSGKLRQIVVDESGQRFERLRQLTYEPLVLVPSQRNAITQVTTWQQHHADQRRHRQRQAAKLLQAAQAGIRRSKRRFKIDHCFRDGGAAAIVPHTQANSPSAPPCPPEVRRFLSLLDSQGGEAEEKQGPGLHQASSSPQDEGVGSVHHP